MSTENIVLAPTSCLLLGLLTLRGPSTAYDLERAVGHLQHEFWDVPHTRHYEETARLERQGLVESKQDPHGRRRRIYTITQHGREALTDWLAAPTPESMQMRDEASLKLFLGELARADDLVALARQQQQIYAVRLADLEATAERFADQPELATRLLPTRFGKAIYSAALEFWASVEQERSA